MKTILCRNYDEPLQPLMMVDANMIKVVSTSEKVFENITELHYVAAGINGEVVRISPYCEDKRDANNIIRKIYSSGKYDERGRRYQ